MKSIIEIIQDQIDAASPILKKIAYLTPIPTRNLTGNIIKPSYDKRTISLLEKDVDAWQSSTKAALAACFVGNNEHKNSFDRTIIQNRCFFDAKEELEKEVKEGQRVLSSIIQELSLRGIIHEEDDQIKLLINKRPLVFISHRKTQYSFVKAFVELLENCGFTGDNLFCSSVPGFNIGLDQDVVETLRNKFVDYDIYVIYVLSTDYFESPYCLNEMGAAWVLQVQNSIIITHDMDESKIDGVVNKTKTRVSFKDTDLQLASRMIELRDKLLRFVNLPKVNDVNWVRYYDKFINEINQTNTLNKPLHASKTIEAQSLSRKDTSQILENAIYRLKEFTIADLQIETGMNKYYISSVLKRYINEGLIETTGNRVHMRYKLKV